jgi:hypothetical protein
MSPDAAMAAVPGESDRWPAGPRPAGAGPVARLRPVPDTEAGTGAPEAAGPWHPRRPPAGFGAGSPANHDGPPPEETGSLLLPPAAAAEPAAEPAPGPDPGPPPPPGPAPAPAFDAVPMPDLSTGLAREPLAEPTAETADPPQPEQPPGGGQTGAVVPRATGRLDTASAAPVAGLTGAVEMTERAVIGDKLRAPGVWCELAPCISHHVDPTALGEADVRGRAVEAGWRYDALGRLTCPACQQTDPRFRGTQAVVRWERDAAITMAALMVAGHHESQRDISAFADRTAVIPVVPDAVIPPGSSQDPGPPARDAWSPG